MILEEGGGLKFTYTLLEIIKSKSYFPHYFAIVPF